MTGRRLFPIGFHTEIAGGETLSLRYYIDQPCAVDRPVVSEGEDFTLLDIAWGPEAELDYRAGWGLDGRNPQAVWTIEPCAAIYAVDRIVGHPFGGLPASVRRIERGEQVRLTVRNNAATPRRFTAALLMLELSEDPVASIDAIIMEAGRTIGATVRRLHYGKQRTAGHPSASGRSHEALVSSVPSSEGSPSSNLATAGISTAADAAAWDALHGCDVRDELGFRPPLTEDERRAMGPPPPAPAPLTSWYYDAEEWRRASDRQRIEILRRALDCAHVLLTQGCDDLDELTESSDSADEVCMLASELAGQGEELPGDHTLDGTPVGGEWGSSPAPLNSQALPCAICHADAAEVCIDDDPRMPLPHRFRGKSIEEIATIAARALEQLIERDRAELELEPGANPSATSSPASSPAAVDITIACRCGHVWHQHTEGSCACAMESCECSQYSPPSSTVDVVAACQCGHRRSAHGILAGNDGRCGAFACGCRGYAPPSLLRGVSVYEDHEP